MVSGAPRALTKIGFRRDVKLFLALLVGFFVALISILLLLLQNNLARTRESISATENLVADVATPELRKVMASFGDAEFDSAMLSIRSRLPVDAIEVRMADGRVMRSGPIALIQEPVTRRFAGGEVKYYFDASAITVLQRHFNLTVVITLIATACGIVLLLLYVPRILRPIEEMLEEARELGEASPDEDEASYLIQTFRDSIGTLKKQEAELKRLHEIEKSRADDLETITSTLTRSLSAGFIALGPDGRVVEMNNAAREILSVTDSNPVAESIGDLFRDSSAASHLAQLVAAREPISRQEIEIRGATGQVKVIGLTTVPLFTTSERFLGTLALFTDLTQVRRLESRVREMQSLADLGVMSAAIAHEFRNSLSTILGLLKLARRTELPPDIDKKLNTAERESLELAEAVTGLLQFARPMRLQLTEVDLRALITDIAERLRDSTRAPIDVRGPHVQMRGDASLLARAFENLIRNAIDATADVAQPRIEIEIAEAPEPSVEIRDNGVGITEKDPANLFLPFHTTKPQGLGMGLPLARKIFLLHGGTISIAARPEGGAVVRVELLDVEQIEYPSPTGREWPLSEAKGPGEGQPLIRPTATFSHEEKG
ncbi:MAG TPA: ATP-binding protein [Thermoanaerobaculia bacterium]|nr:ATP-binding protein [Thermoanaerobaculia bacterium]